MNDSSDHMISESSRDSSDSEIICDDDIPINFKQGTRFKDIDINSASDINCVSSSSSLVKNKKFTIDNILGLNDENVKSDSRNCLKPDDNKLDVNYPFKPIAVSPASVCGTSTAPNVLEILSTKAAHLIEGLSSTDRLQNGNPLNSITYPINGMHFPNSHPSLMYTNWIGLHSKVSPHGNYVLGIQVPKPPGKRFRKPGVDRKPRQAYSAISSSLIPS